MGAASPLLPQPHSFLPFFSSFLPSSLTSFLFWRDWNYRFPLLVRESCDSHRLLLCSGKADSPLAARARPRPRCPPLPLPLRRHPAPPAIRMAVEEVVGRKGGGEGGRERERKKKSEGRMEDCASKKSDKGRKQVQGRLKSRQRPQVRARGANVTFNIQRSTYTILIHTVLTFIVGGYFLEI